LAVPWHRGRHVSAVNRRGIAEQPLVFDSVHSPFAHSRGSDMAQGINHLTTATFDETVIGSSAPVFVDFSAERCGPCKLIAPVPEEMAAELGEQLTITKLNVDENPEIAMRYNVMSIPTLLLFDGGDIKKKIVGAKGKGALMQELDEFLATSR